MTTATQLFQIGSPRHRQGTCTCSTKVGACITSQPSQYWYLVPPLPQGKRSKSGRVWNTYIATFIEYRFQSLTFASPTPALSLFIPAILAPRYPFHRPIHSLTLPFSSLTAALPFPRPFSIPTSHFLLFPYPHPFLHTALRGTPPIYLRNNHFAAGTEGKRMAEHKPEHPD